MWKTQKIIIGVDEAGRGPLAGPVLAVAVYAPQCLDIGYPNIGDVVIKDSKKMTAGQRKRAYEFLKNQPGVEWGIGRTGERVIDRINILEATKLAMTRAVNNLLKKVAAKVNGRPHLQKREVVLLIDGNTQLDANKIKLPQRNWGIGQIPIVKGDQKVPIISMASIIAKVSRDRAMARYHKKYPEYNFSQHKGYPTKKHYQTIFASGPCKLHRQSFRLG